MKTRNTKAKASRSRVPHPTRIDLKPGPRGRIVAVLDARLGDTLDLASQVKQAHWNVKGMQFIALHELFDKLAGELLDYTDLIAERITSLGGVAHGTVRMSGAASCLPEFPDGGIEGRKAVQVLADRYAALAALVRDAIDVSAELGDADTSDLFTEVSRGLDKSLWFLEAHLQD